MRFVVKILCLFGLLHQISSLVVTDDLVITEPIPDLDSAWRVTAGINYVAASFYDSQVNSGNGNSGGYYIYIYHVDPDTKALTLEHTIVPMTWSSTLNTNPSVTTKFFTTFGIDIMFWGSPDYEILAVSIKHANSNINPSVNKLFSVIFYTKETGTWRAMKRVDCAGPDVYYTGILYFDRSSFYATIPRLVYNCDNDIAMVKLTGTTYNNIVQEHSYSTNNIRPYFWSPQISPGAYQLGSLSIAPNSNIGIVCYTSSDKQCRRFQGTTTIQSGSFVNLPARYSGTSYFMGSWGAYMLSDTVAYIVITSSNLNEIDEILHFEINTNSVVEYPDSSIKSENAVVGSDERWKPQRYMLDPERKYVAVNDFLTSGDYKTRIYRVSDLLSSTTTPAPVAVDVKIQEGINTLINSIDTHNNTAFFSYKSLTGDITKFARVSVLIPPTPAPTMSPTQRPTFECVSSTGCLGANEYCSSVNTCETKVCTTHADCIGEFLPNRLAYCDSVSGMCKDSFSGSCSTQLECKNKAERELAKKYSLGQATQTVSSSSNLTNTRTAIKTIVGTTNSTTVIDQKLYSFISGTEQATFDPLLFDTVNDDALILQQIKLLVCGDAADVCTVELPNRRRLMEERELQNSITVTVTYDVDAETFNSIETSENFNSATFIQALADAVGVLPGNVTLILVDGSFTIEYVVADESDGQEPLDQTTLDAINAVSSNVNSITSTVATQLGLPESEFSSSSVDKCADRDCNGRGTCDPATGICTCTDTSYWGVNCETLVTCLNDGEKDPFSARCFCSYPYYGLRCGSTRDCACQAV